MSLSRHPLLTNYYHNVNISTLDFDASMDVNVTESNNYGECRNEVKNIQISKGLLLKNVTDHLFYITIVNRSKQKNRWSLIVFE